MQQTEMLNYHCQIEVSPIEKQRRKRHAKPKFYIVRR